MFGCLQMTMEELVVMFHVEMTMLLKNVNQFPMNGDENNILDSLIASRIAIGVQLVNG